MKRKFKELVTTMKDIKAGFTEVIALLKLENPRIVPSAIVNLSINLIMIVFLFIKLKK